ncbi:MAG: hypothetical protein U1F77_11405 [Kiritimatiellia bacterium]
MEWIELSSASLMKHHCTVTLSAVSVTLKTSSTDHDAEQWSAITFTPPQMVTASSSRAASVPRRERMCRTTTSSASRRRV